MNIRVIDLNGSVHLLLERQGSSLLLRLEGKDAKSLQKKLSLALRRIDRRKCSNCKSPLLPDRTLCISCGQEHGWVPDHPREKAHVEE